MSQTMSAVADHVCDLDSVMEFGFKHSYCWYKLINVDTRFVSAQSTPSGTRAKKHSLTLIPSRQHNAIAKQKGRETRINSVINK